MQVRKSNTDDFIKKSIEVHGEIYDYSRVDYHNNNTKVEIICKTHGTFKQTPEKHIIRKQGCKQCGLAAIGSKLRSCKETFIAKATKIHGDRFDYSLVDYKTARLPVEIICRLHGSFQQVPYSHLAGNGCDKCGRAIQNDKKRFTNEIFSEKSRSVHGDKYDYSQIVYKTARLPVKIICKLHGIFEQTPDSHLNGKGCPECGNESIGNSLRMTLPQFLSRAIKIHGDKYDYSLVAYKTARLPLDIICPMHGIFTQPADVHLNRKAGCPRCGDRWVMQNTWLDSLGVPNDAKHRQVILMISGRKFVVDGYDSETKTIYEFWGSYYHGHPDIYKQDDKTTFYNVAFGELYQKTLEKREIILSAGYKLIEMWEHHYNGLSV